MLVVSTGESDWGGDHPSWGLEKTTELGVLWKSSQNSRARIRVLGGLRIRFHHEAGCSLFDSQLWMQLESRMCVFNVNPLLQVRYSGTWQYAN